MATSKPIPSPGTLGVKLLGQYYSGVEPLNLAPHQTMGYPSDRINIPRLGVLIVSRQLRLTESVELTFRSQRPFLACTPLPSLFAGVLLLYHYKIPLGIAPAGL